MMDMTRKSREVPKGERECRYCTFYHPERPQRPCSAFRQCANEHKDCSLYIDDGGKRDGES